MWHNLFPGFGWAHWKGFNGSSFVSQEETNPIRRTVYRQRTLNAGRMKKTTIKDPKY